MHKKIVALGSILSLNCHTLPEPQPEISNTVPATSQRNLAKMVYSEIYARRLDPDLSTETFMPYLLTYSSQAVEERYSFFESFTFAIGDFNNDLKKDLLIITKPSIALEELLFYDYTPLNSLDAVGMWQENTYDLWHVDYYMQRTNSSTEQFYDFLLHVGSSLLNIDPQVQFSETDIGSLLNTALEAPVKGKGDSFGCYVLRDCIL